MRRRIDRPFSFSRQGAGPSGQRKGDGPSSQSYSCNLINERLIEGTQASSFFKEPGKQEARPYHQGSQLHPTRDEEGYDDMQLDAFDLELLAQSDGTARSFQSSSRTQRFSAYLPRQVDPPTQVSRFFNDSQFTLHRSLGSSSSEVDIKVDSSPLARLQTGRAAGFLGEQDLETRSITQDLPSHSLISGASKPQTNSDASSMPYQDPSISLHNLPVSSRGIVLVSVRELPDNYRSLFHFPVFNAVQSKCFQSIYKSDDNVVLAAPTGSGKTAVMELAICRLLNNLKDEQFKVIYQAPTKSLCSERFRDWTVKFHSLGLQCAELTGDTDHTQLRNVQNSQIIITTPEKWDSMTRKWRDHIRLIQLVKLFLVDEVHTLKEVRGATLEAVVSRMKSMGSNVRFIALSATIPNSEDIATWLGKNATSQHIPAHREHFGEDFRPVKLQKFVYGYQSHGNDFAFDKLCNSKLPDVIATHSCKKPIMIFCCTRNSTVTTAKELARLWSMSNPPVRHWKGPSKPRPAHNNDLKTTLTAGVAFHHGGLDTSDRHQVEHGFLEGDISIICCTSTLAVGVNLPCHLVIIKNTVGWQDGRCQEYSDLEVMQMLGRAGRPQFDDSATAVILTRRERVSHYERLVSGSQSLESCLHLSLVDHLNAEIGLGNITNIDSAVKWLAGTFLFVRLRRNPTHYKLKEGANREDEDEMLRQVCEKDIKLLQKCGLVASEDLKSTPFGDAMARYYVRYETMKTFHTLKPHSDVAQILSVLSQADEFRDVRLKAGEKSLYKEINRNSIDFPISVDVALPAHKISLLIQSELGGLDFPTSEQFQKHKFPFQQDKNFVFSHVNRLIRCIIDCHVHLEDSVTVRNALELARSLAARVWDNSPFQMRQIEQIGVVAVRKLAAAGIDSIEALEATEPHQIDMVLSKNPPFGVKMRTHLSGFPKLRVSITMTGKDIKPGHRVRVHFKAEIAFMNEKCPTYFQRRPVFVCFLAETSDGHLIDFRRISAIKLQRTHEILLNAELNHHDQCITCHVMCDEIAGTSRCATLNPDLPRSLFSREYENKGTDQAVQERGDVVISGKLRAHSPSKAKIDRYDSDDWLFGEFLEAEVMEDWDINDTRSKLPESSKSITAQTNAASKVSNEKDTATKPNSGIDQTPTKLGNGRWACNHKCKDKTACKHLCCREGLTNPPNVSRKKSYGIHQETVGSNQLTLSASISRKDPRPSTVTDAINQQLDKDSFQISDLGHTQRRPLPGLEKSSNDSLIIAADSSSDYGDESFDDLPSPSTLLFGNALDSLDFSSQHILYNGTQAVKGGPELTDNWVDDNDGDVLFSVQSSLIKPFVKSKRFDLVDLVSPEPQEMISNPPQIDGCRGQKRKLSMIGISNNDNNKKKVKRNETGQRTDTTSPNKARESLIVDAKCSEIKSSMSLDAPALPSLPTDWEDIDPALLNEFKDIVDFF